MYVMGSILVVGFLCNLAIGPVSARHHLQRMQP
jgi:small ligand-binding sensory domain FIST